jgi:hypothetical protein
MRRSDLVRNPGKSKAVRTSQIVFGERQHLLRVLDSVERSALPAPRLEQERRVIEQLIHARTQELNRINAGWDEKVGVVLSAEVKPETLDSLSRQAPKEDFRRKRWGGCRIILIRRYGRILRGIRTAMRLLCRG